MNCLVIAGFLFFFFPILTSQFVVYLFVFLGEKTLPSLYTYMYMFMWFIMEISFFRQLRPVWYFMFLLFLQQICLIIIRKFICLSPFHLENQNILVEHFIENPFIVEISSYTISAISNSPSLDSLTQASVSLISLTMKHINVFLGIIFAVSFKDVKCIELP